MRVILRSVLAVFVLLLCVLSFADTRYQVIDLGAFPDSKWEYFPTRIYNNEQILGSAFNISNSGNFPYARAFLWTPDTGYVDLPAVTGVAFAGGISPSGRIVGINFIGGQILEQACVWDQNFAPSLFGPTPFFESSANDIGPDGSIYGDFDLMPTVFKTDGSLSFLPTPYPDFPYGQAGRLSKAGNILGFVYEPITFRQIYGIWNATLQFTPIDTGPDIFSFASGLNDHGWVVGSTGQRAFVWTQAGGSTILPGLGAGSQYDVAYGINNRNQIVGGSIPQYGDFTSAVIWEDGQIKDLNTLIGPYNGWFLSAAYGINDQGEIVGFGNFFDPANPVEPILFHAFLLKPIR